jgi:hypothetical protein
MNRLVVLVSALCLGTGPQAPNRASLPQPVAALIAQKCVECHSGPRPPASLSLEPNKILSSTLDKPSTDFPGRKLIDTTVPEKSYLLAKVEGDRSIKGSRMPSRRPRLAPAELKLLRDWILSLKGTIL